MTEKYKNSVIIPTNFIEENTIKAIKRADIIMVNVPAFAQEAYNELIAKFGKTGQIVIYPCGGFSAVNFNNYLKTFKRENDFTVCETGSFVYTTKLTGNGSILIKSMKSSVMFSAYNPKDTDRILNILNQIYPQFYKAENVWQTSFSNPSSVLHTITTLCNMSRIEQLGAYKNSFYDITPSVARVMEKVDKERCEVASHFYKNVMITEDIPYSLVPISTIGKKLGIETPNTDAIINLACMSNDIDYWEQGRNANKIGFKNIQAIYQDMAVA